MSSPSAIVKDLEAKIVSDTKNLNLITKIVNGIKGATTPAELRTWYQSLSRVFGHLATKGLIASDPADSSEDYIKAILSGAAAEPPSKKQKRMAPKSGVNTALDQAREWCRNKWADSIHNLLVIATNEMDAKEASYDLATRTAALNGFMEFIPLAAVPIFQFIFFHCSLTYLLMYRLFYRKRKRACSSRSS